MDLIAITSPGSALAAFLVSVAVFHLAFVYVWPLDNRRWKQIDYIWLSAAVLSLLAGADQARR